MTGEALKVAVALDGAAGVSSLRLKWPAEAVARKTGWDVKVYDAGLKIAEEAGRYWIKGIDLEGLDLFVMQRPPSLKHARLIHHLQRIGVAVVMDLDDDLSQIPKSSASWKSWNGTRTNWRHALAAAEQADLVTCSTRAIERRFAKHGRCAILQNRLPDRLTLPRRESEDGPFTVLWSGYSRGHEGDLEEMGKALQRIPDVRVRVVGPPDLVAGRLGVRHDQVTATGWTKFDNWHEVLADEAAQADVGIVPLGLTRFNQAKSWLKGMEFLNAGLPVVASPTAEYVRLKRAAPNEVAIAKTPDEWYRMLNALKDRTGPGSRREVREDVQREFEATRGLLVLSEGVDGWIDAWSRAVNRRRGLTKR